MTKPTIRIHNAETNEVIDREMTAAEFKKYEATLASDQSEQVEDEAKATAKSALLAKLGLTADEAKLLLG
jgi:hypothetical protein